MQRGFVCIWRVIQRTVGGRFSVDNCLIPAHLLGRSCHCPWGVRERTAIIGLCIGGGDE